MSTAGASGLFEVGAAQSSSSGASSAQPVVAARYTRLLALLSAVLLLPGVSGFAPQARAASPVFQAAVLADAPLLYFQLNEPTGHSINYGSLGPSFNGVYQGTITRGVSTSSGDTGISFDSDQDYIETSATAPGNLTGNPTFTAETLVFIPHNGSALQWAPFLNWGVAANGRAVYFGFSGDDAKKVFVGFYNGGLQSPGGASSVIPKGSWHHIVWVRQGGGTDQQGSTLYVDGVDVTSSLVADPDLSANGTTPTVTTTAFRINHTGDLSRFFVGTMDEIALYDRALSATEVMNHYSALSTSIPALSPIALAILAAALLMLGGCAARRRHAAA